MVEKGDRQPLQVFVVSDFTGETAEHVAKAALSQFATDAITLQRFRYINNKDRALEVLEEAEKERAMVVCTLVDHDLRRWFMEKAGYQGTDVIDILGPILDMLERRLEHSPLETPGLMRRMDEEYFRRVKAIEFAIKCDDGRCAEHLLLADVVILGVSRTSKTPLCMYLAHRGFMVGNVPLIPETEPPKEIFDIPPEKVFGLTVQPEKLVDIRRERLRLLGLDSEISNYAQWERVEEELQFAKNIMRKIGCRVLNVTNRAIEETAQEILDYLRA
ncbi:MAG TPA: pyruvate, water dikinase regulatory protein [Synergistales bacterium]|nr:pyruvate, water dikinase regulatory protein [Synergistales bacterium]